MVEGLGRGIGHGYLGVVVCLRSGVFGTSIHITLFVLLSYRDISTSHISTGTRTPLRIYYYRISTLRLHYHDAYSTQSHHPNQNCHITLFFALDITYLLTLLRLRSPQRPPRRQWLHCETPGNNCACGFLQHDRRDVSSQAKARESLQRRVGCFP
jgi:hypothetical protein